MKKQIISWGMMLAAAFTLTNCAEEIENPNQQPEKQGYPYEIVASTVDTKTVNEGMSTKWDDNDAINLFHAEAESEVYGTNDKFTIADVETGRFTGMLTEALEAGKSYDWYALYPYNSNIATPGDRADGFTYIGHSKGLNQTGYDNMASLKETICPLYGVAKAVASSETPSITMNHLTSVVAIKVTNTTEEPLTITTASLTAEEDIVGSYFIDITKSPVVYKASEGFVKNTAVVNVSEGTALAKGESATLYLAIKPFTAEAGTSLTLSVNDYAKDPKVLTSDVTFHAGKIKTLNFAYDKVTPKTVTFDFTKNEWNLPVSTSDAGDAGNILEPVVSGEVTMTVENGTASNKTRLWEGSNGIDLRAYKGSSLSFSVPSGHVITKMTFTGGKVADNLFETVTGTYSSKVWSGSANPVVLNILGTVNVETITIEYGLGEAEAPKTKQELSFPESSYSIVMGEPFTAPVLSGAMTDVTYSSSKEEVATVSDNGAVTLVGPGTTVITATAAEDETYASASASYTLIVSPAPSSSLLSLPWNEDFSGDLSSYTILNGGGTTAIQTSGTMYAGGEGNELLIAKGNGSLAAKISTGGYTGTLTLTFKSNHADYLKVTSETSGVEVYKNTDTEYIINISKSMDTFVITLTNVKNSNTRVDDISLVIGGSAEPEDPAVPVVASVEQFIAAAEDAVVYELTGIITKVENTEYGNFYLKDSTGDVLIYGLCSPEGVNKYWAESGARVGDIITVRTVRSSHNGTAQGKNALFVNLVDFYINPDVINVKAEDTSANFEFSCGVGYNIDYPDGVVQKSEAHDNETTISTYTVEFPANTTAAEKQYEITITADMSLILDNPIEGVEYVRTVTIKQAAAEQGGGEPDEPVVLLSEDFSSLTTWSSTDVSSLTVSGKDWKKNAGKMYAQNGCIKFGSSTAAANSGVKLPKLTSVSGSVNVRLTFKAVSSAGAYAISVTSSTGSVGTLAPASITKYSTGINSGESTATALSNAFATSTEFSVDITGVTSTTEITIKVPASAKQWYIDDVKVETIN